eukprot:COSAG01_NODE_4509_length_4967_cov_2.290058_2_plen_74_part_00
MYRRGGSFEAGDALNLDELNDALRGLVPAQYTLSAATERDRHVAERALAANESAEAVAADESSLRNQSENSVL